MNFAEVMEDAKESLGAKGVYGTPYEKNGVTIIPAARIMGGVGGGEGPAPIPNDGEEETQPTKATAAGAGYGLSGHPTGAFVIRGNDVSWVPAVDVNRMMLGFQVAMIVLFLAIRSIAKSRSRIVEKAGV